MKTIVGLFAFAALVGAAMAGAYWLTAREPAGTALLGLTAAALAFTCGYAATCERDAKIEGDAEVAADDDLGVFTTHSAWPICIAVSATAALIGVLYSPLICLLALVALGLCLWRMGAESARVAAEPARAADPVERTLQI